MPHKPRNLSITRTRYLKALDMGDLLPGVQALWTCTGTIQYGMAAVKLELIIYGIQSLLGIFITAVTYPPALTTMR